MARLDTGKIDPVVLGRLLSLYTHRGGRIEVGAAIGEDAAVIDMGDVYLIAKTDPITHATDQIGRYSVNINANDIAAMGGNPGWFLATVLMPVGSTSEELEKIFAQIYKACENLGIFYCGGHTEITSSVRNPVVIGQMLGEAPRDNLKPTSGAREGDLLMMTKCAAIEATAIIALERGSELCGLVAEELLGRAGKYLEDPGISVVSDALLLAGMPAVHALHDPTEGGIATGIFEMAEASGLGVTVYAGRIKVSEETRVLCDCLGVNPLGTFASGALLAALEPGSVEEVSGRLRKADVTFSIIGTMGPPGGGKWLIRDGRQEPLPVFHQDELSRIFG